MALYAAIAPAESEALGAAMVREFPEAHYQIAPGQFLVSASHLTTRQVGERLGIYDGTLGRVLIMNVENYTGWHSKDMWEWVGSRRIGDAAQPPRIPDAV